MLRIYCFVSLCLLFAGNICWARVVVKEQELFYKEELINGKTFAHRYELRQDATGAVRKEAWRIDGKEVVASDYEEEILEAEKNERRVQRAQEELARSADFEFKEKTQQALVKKLLNKVTKNLMHELQTIERHGLLPYAVFSDATVSAQEYQQVVGVLVPTAQILVHEQSPDFVQLQELYERLEPLQERFKFFMRATIDRAIEKCDDTRFLKELLALVS